MSKSDESDDTLKDPTPERNRKRYGLLIGCGVLALLIFYVFSASTPLSNEASPGDTRTARLTTRMSGAPTPSADTLSGAAAFTEDDPVIGPLDAQLTIIEFSDFECPFCQQTVSVIKEIMHAYPSEVRFQYRDFPLEEAHPEALRAAEAAGCAHMQGKFWDYHDLLFQGGAIFSRELYTAYALQAGIDLALFNTCLDGRAQVPEVLDDLQDGTVLGIEGTPTFFINGVKYEGALTFDEFREIIDGLLR